MPIWPVMQQNPGSRRFRKTNFAQYNIMVCLLVELEYPDCGKATNTPLEYENTK